jgi:predicted fused transcriptional regulator/phosphomethylpyrimidine kinase
VFHHEGAFGIEPQAYFTGADAQAVALRVRSLLSAE